MAAKQVSGKGTPSKSSGSKGGVFSIMRDEWVFMRVLLPYLSMLFAMFAVFLLAAITRIIIWMDAHYLTRTQESLDRNTWIVSCAIVVSGAVLTAFAGLFWGQRKAVIVKEHAMFTVTFAHDWFLFAIWEDKGDWMFGRVSIITHLFLCLVIGLTWCFRYWAVSHAEDDATFGGAELADIGLGDSSRIG